MPVLQRQTQPPELAASSLDEHGIVERSRHDPHAFSPLYARYAASIYGYCYHRLGSQQAAEDATSVIFAKALTALPSYQGPSFRAWLFGIAHHVVADAQRGRRPDASL